MSHNRENVIWSVPEGTVSVDHAQLAVLMDIRSEIRKLNALLHCQNFIGIPVVLREIRANTAKPKRRRRIPLRIRKRILDRVAQYKARIRERVENYRARVASRRKKKRRVRR